MPKAIEWTARDVEQFKKLCGIFCTKNIPDAPTWDEAFALFSGVGKASLRRRQFEAAMDGNTAMLIFLGKNYLGQTDQGQRAEEAKPTGNRLAVMIEGSKFSKAANG